MSNEEKLSICVKLSQSYIRLFLKEHMDTDQLQDIEKMFLNCPVVGEDISQDVGEFGEITNFGGLATKDKISINLRQINKTNINNEFELNRLLGTIIHEYAHRIRAINNEYGVMFEEAFASIFAETCINNARLKLSDNKDNKEVFGMLTSVNYQEFESQARGILYILKQNNLDQKLIAEYIAGNQEKFKQVCMQIFGNTFAEYFNTVSSNNNKTSESMLINIVVQYIKQKGLNIGNYWSNEANQLSSNNLYFRGSPTLCKCIVAAGKENFKSEEQEFYRYYEYSVKTTNEDSDFINEEKISRIKSLIETKFSLEGKTPEEIHDTIIDLCSTYIQHQNRDDEESKIFINEIVKIIPDIEIFKTKFVNLRVAGLDKNIFENLDSKNITYNDIVSSMDKLLNIETAESDFSR